MISINLPKHVLEIIEKLHINGYEAYAVGGCVRDCIMGLEPKDWDITTSALPDQVKQIFRKTIDTGLKHGTVTVLMNGIPYEITTYRIDGLYENHRKPVGVEFTDEIIEDLRRRDFTINAMAYNPKKGLVDAFDGMADIQNKILRCVGNPDERFNEDALRMLRAIRFSAKLAFNIDPGTKAAIVKHAQLIQKISGERIRMEMTKILTSKHPQEIEKLVELGLMQFILPEFMPCVQLKQNNKHHIYDVDQHTYETLKHIEPTETLRWTMLLHDIGKGYSKTVDAQGVDHFHGHYEISVKIAKEVLARIRFDNHTTADILKLIEYHDFRIEPNMKQVRGVLHKLGEALFESYLKVQRADILAQNPIYHPEYLPKLDAIEDCYRQVIAENHCISLKSLAINGKDLTEMGIHQGKNIGIILNQLLELVLDDPGRNNRAWLLEKAKTFCK